MLGQLVAKDDWLPEDYALPHPVHYRQYLLHADPLERFSLVSFVWGPGQRTPIHDHRVWGLVGVLRGAELATDYSRAADGSLIAGAEERLEPGRVVVLTPATRDIHSIRNAYEDRVSISVHVYGGNIGAVRRGRLRTGWPGKAICLGLFEREPAEPVGSLGKSSGFIALR